ncbi:hypothetical protein BDP55DRAFT_769228 [Colletotrichum godetiae]|uniref:Uncharacterized protein n=1 Tax=Colletotrichum godetiae TaxID=1209918 RepID=A0AAJ0AIG0_9PEZI|nr:uncharacterized protein BDP55DRAFT_769228 [Colletotrichum godetiae]KAK1674490.1 hypothetical protein BDP55DRAFT_769228 [Colletotrichum godetiae]
MLEDVGQWKTSDAWQISDNVSKHCCGSLFANLVMTMLESKENPLVAASEVADGNIRQLPLGRTKCVQNRIHRFEDEQQFSFSAQDDQSHLSWAKRTGAPLAKLQSRWEALEDVEYSVQDEVEGVGDLQSSNERGSSTKSTYQGRGPPLAKSILEMTPEFYWTAGGEHWNHKILEVVASGVIPTAYHEVDPMELIRYRLEATAMADRIVSLFKLPVPLGESCMSCDSFGFYHSDLCSRFCLCLLYGKLYPRPTVFQGFFLPSFVP